MKNETLVIGKITSTHGIKGELKVQPLTDDVSRFQLLDQITLAVDGKEKSYPILQVRFHKNMVLLTLEGVNDRNQGEALRNLFIEIPREQGVPLEEDRFYIVDLIGLDVAEKGVVIGTLKEVLQHGAADLYVIQEGDKEWMLPATQENILHVDLEANRMDVFVPEGLREL